MRLELCKTVTIHLTPSIRSQALTQHNANAVVAINDTVGRSGFSASKQTLADSRVGLASQCVTLAEITQRLLYIESNADIVHQLTIIPEQNKRKRLNLATISLWDLMLVPLLLTLPRYSTAFYWQEHAAGILLATNCLCLMTHTFPFPCKSAILESCLTDLCW